MDIHAIFESAVELVKQVGEVSIHVAFKNNSCINFKNKCLLQGMNESRF